MGDLARMMASTSITFTPATYDSVYPVPYGSLAATDLSPDAALTIATVYACVRAISEDIGSVPLHIYKRSGESKTIASNHPLYDLLHDQPNDYQTAMEFREMMTAFAMLRKRGIAELIPGPRGRIDQIKPLHPDLVTSEVADGQLRYAYEDPIKRRRRILLPDEVLVLRGPFGSSIAAFARETFALALTLRGAAGRTYARGVRTQGALTHPKTLSTTARENLRAALDKYGAGGDNEGRPLLLEEGMTWASVQMSMKDAEFVAIYGATDKAALKFFRVPPHKVGELDRATNNNIEQQSIEYVTDAIRPWAERWEGVIRRDLIIAPQIFFAEHNLEGLLRGDIETRYAAYAVGRQWGWLCTNDIRTKENLNPIAGGWDDFLSPLNMTTDKGILAYAPPARQQAIAAQLRVMTRDAAGRAVRKEQATVAKLAEKTGGQGPEWEAGVRAFYAEHARFLSSLHIVGDEQADAYCVARCAATLARHVADETEEISTLASLAIESTTKLLTAGEAAA
jgi:HK97 family phage portal protein